jgi:hypothetical protein
VLPHGESGSRPGGRLLPSLLLLLLPSFVAPKAAFGKDREIPTRGANKLNKISLVHGDAERHFPTLGATHGRRWFGWGQWAEIGAGQGLFWGKGALFVYWLSFLVARRNNPVKD